MQNLLLEIPYKFKKSYGGTPEPQTTQDTPWPHGASLKGYNLHLHQVLLNLVLHHMIANKYTVITLQVPGRLLSRIQ